MVYLGVGILAASLSLLVYKQGPFVRQHLLGIHKSTSESSGEDHHGEVEDEGKGSEVPEDSPIGEQILLRRRDVDKSGKNTNDRISNVKPKPKSQTANGDPIPSFTIAYRGNGESEKRLVSTPKSESLETTADIAANKTSQTQQQPKPFMPPPARPNPTSKRKPDAEFKPPPPPSLQPPPSNSTLKPPPKPTSSLRPPPSTASTLRAPPTRSLAPPNSSLAPTSSTLSPSTRPSKKVLLDPGHSPLDWAHLVNNPPTPTFLRGSSVPLNLIRVPPSLLRYHNGRKGKDAWGVWQGKVYNLTPYMKFHPGGVDQLMKGAGRDKDGESLFLEIHPWVSWEGMLGECLVGILVGEAEAQVRAGSEGGLEEMD